jgi:kinetochore protein Mis12/MTW1
VGRESETRLEREPEWAEAADKELEQGLVSFQTLLESTSHLILFEAWSLRNIFAVTPPDLPLVVPHQACLDLDRRRPEKEAELLAGIDELRRKVENVTLLPTRVHVTCFFVYFVSRSKSI